MKKIYLLARLVLLALLALRTIPASAQTTVNGNQVLVPGASLSLQVPNDTGTGTTQYSIAKLTGTGKAVISGISDTSGFVGIVRAGAGSSSNASIAQVGETPCNFDGPTTANDYVINSSTIGGDCSDGGGSLPTVQNLGRVLSTHGGAGLYTVMVSVSGGIAAPASIGGSVTTNQIPVGSGLNTVTGSNALTASNGGITSVVASQSTLNLTLTNTTALATGTIGVNDAGMVSMKTASGAVEVDSSGNAILAPSGTAVVEAFANGNVTVQPAASDTLTLGRSADSNSALNVYSPITLKGSSSGSASIGVAAAASTPNEILLPLATGTTGQTLITDGGSPQQLSWDTRVKISGSITTGNCAQWSDSVTITSAVGTCGGNVLFSGIQTATNTGATMTVGTGASLGVSGSGAINATTLNGATFAAPGAIGGGTPSTGAFTTITGALTGNVTGNASGTAATFTGNLTGDTTSVGMATTTVKINGTTVPVNSAADQFLRTTGSAVATYATMPDCQDSAGNHVNYTASTHALSCGTSASGAGTTSFSSLTGATNTTAAMVLGSGSSLTVSGTGTNNATAVNGTTVPVNSSADQVIVTTSSAVGSWASVPNCIDSAGNHINYTVSTHLFSCGTSASGAGTTSFSSLTGSTNTTAAMVVGTGASLAATGSGTIDATTLGTKTFASPAAIGTGTPANITGLVITANTNFAGPLTGNVTGNASGTSATFTGNLTGDTTSVAMATTTVKVNGTSVPTNAAADQVIVTTASATGSWASVPNCTDSGGNHINYTTATHLFSCGTSAPAGSGTVTSVSSGNLSPLFTVAVGTPTVTPAFSFTLSNAAAHTFFMNNTGGSAAPGFQTAGEADLPAATVFTDQNATFGAHTYDFSAATIFKVKVTAAYAPTVDGQCGVNSTTHLFVCGFNSVSTITIPTTIAAVSHNFLTSYTQTTGAFTQAQPTLADIAAGSAPAGLFDFSTGTFKLPVAAGGTVTANGNILFDSTAKNWLIWGNAVSNFINVTPSSVTPVNADCVNWSVVGGVFTTGDATYKCVKNFSDLNTFSNGVNAQVGAGYTILLADGAKDVTLSNAGAQTVTLPSSVPAAGWWVDIQNVGAGTWTSNRNAHNIDGGTTNFVLATGQGTRVYSDGSNYWTQRGVGGSAATVTSVALAGPTGFVISGSPVTSSGTLTFAMPAGWVNGDILYGNGSNSVARLAGVTSATPGVFTSTGTGAAANAPVWTASVGGGSNPVLATVTSLAQGDYVCGDATPKLVNCQAGIAPNAQTGTAYTILATDRAKYLTCNNASPVALTLPQSGSTGFTSNFFIAIRNIGAGACTITPTTSTVNGNASLLLLKGMQTNIISDNTNYFATVSGQATGTTGSISGAITGPGCDSGTVTINGAATGMVASATPTTYPGDGIFWLAYVSSSNTVTVKVCSDVNLTPTASTYNVSLVPLTQ